MTTKPKIAFLHPTGYPMGGGEKVSAVHSIWFAANGFEPYIFTNEIRHDLLTDIYTDNAKLVEVAGHATRRSFSENLVAAAREHEIDFIVLQGAFYSDIEWLAGNLPEGCKLIYSCHGTPFWEIQSRYDRRRLKAAASVGKKLKYHLISNPLEKLTGNIRKKTVRQYRMLYEFCDAFTVLCHGYKDIVIERLGLPATEDKITVIHNALAPHDKEYKTEKGKTVLYMGRLTYSDKRIDRLLRIWEMVSPRFPDWKLQIAGDGAERENLETLAGELGLKRYEFKGHTTDPDEYYDDAAILCLTSTAEGAPLVVAEAQRAGVVPIAFDSAAGIADLISPERGSGILAEPFDLEDYARKLSTLMSDNALRTRMQKSAIDKTGSYDLETVGRKWETLFNKLR